MDRRPLHVMLVTVLAFTALTGAARAAGPAPSLMEGDEAPDFTLTDSDGAEVTLSDFRGRAVVILDFGRFTCKPCRSTAQELQKLHEAYKDAGLRVFQVNLDGPEAEEVVPKAREELGVTFPVLPDADGRVADLYKVEVIPFLVVIDRDGIVRHLQTGIADDTPAKLVEVYEQYKPLVAEGMEAPDFMLEDSTGQAHRLTDYRDKAVVVLDFGRFSCIPCRNTAQALQALSEDGERASTLRIFQVNLDGPEAATVVPKALTELGVTFPVLLDSEYRVADAYGVEVIPFVVVIDPGGTVRRLHIGYQEDMAETIAKLHDEYRPGGPTP